MLGVTQLIGFGSNAESDGIIATNFSEYSAGSPPGDWTSRYISTGFTYNVETVAAAMSGQALQWVATVSNNRFISWDAVPAVADYEILMRARAIQAGSSNGQMLAPYAGGRVSGTATTRNIYYAGFSYSTGGTGYTSGQSKIVGNTLSALDSIAGPSPNYTTNTWLYVRSQVIGTTLRRRVWYSGTSEPGSWDGEITDGSLSAGGWIGLYKSGAGPNSEIDYFAVSIAGKTIPVPV